MPTVTYGAPSGMGLGGAVQLCSELIHQSVVVHANGPSGQPLPFVRHGLQHCRHTSMGGTGIALGGVAAADVQRYQLVEIHARTPVTTEVRQCKPNERILCVVLMAYTPLKRCEAGLRQGFNRQQQPGHQH